MNLGKFFNNAVDAIGDRVDQDAFALTIVQRQLCGFVDNYFTQLGEEKLHHMVTNDLSIETEFDPNDLEWLKEMGRSYRKLNGLTNAEIAGTVPQWAVNVIARSGDQGRLWLRNQVNIFRSYFQEGDDGGPE